jgi:hypothetical protein
MWKRNAYLGFMGGRYQPDRTAGLHVHCNVNFFSGSHNYFWQNALKHSARLLYMFPIFEAVLFTMKEYYRARYCSHADAELLLSRKDGVMCNIQR